MKDFLDNLYRDLVIILPSLHGKKDRKFANIILNICNLYFGK